MKVNCLAQEHKNNVPRPVLEPGPLDPVASAFTMRSPQLHIDPIITYTKQTTTMIRTMTATPTTTPITIHFQSSSVFSVVVTVAAGPVV